MLPTSLLKLSVPHAIKTAALCGYCSLGSCRDLTGPEESLFTLKTLSPQQPLNRTCQRHPPPMAFLWHSWHTHDAPSSAPAWLPLSRHCMSAVSFSHRIESEEIFLEAGSLYHRITPTLTWRYTTLRQMGRESVLFPSLSLSQSYTHAHTPSHTHTHTHTHTTLYTPLIQRTLDYSANGCTTDHRPARLQTGLLCALSVGWKCCRGPRQCACGGLKCSMCVCVCVCTRTSSQAEKCSHAAQPNERAGQPLNGH